MKLQTVGLVLPPDFPTDAYNAVHERLKKYKDSHSVQRSLFGFGWNGLAYRYQAMCEYDEAFTSSVRLSNSPPHQERYEQENALSSFFVSAVSSIECFFFYCLCIGSIIDSERFPISCDRDLKLFPGDIAKKFTSYEKWRNDLVVCRMNGCLENKALADTVNIRNVLAHRGVPPRKFYAFGERDGMATIPTNINAPSNEWLFDFTIDEQTTAYRRKLVSGILNGLLTATDAFCIDRLPR